MSKITPELIQDAMFSSKEGYVSSVIDSIEFDLDRKLSDEEQRQVEQHIDQVINAAAEAKQS